MGMGVWLVLNEQYKVVKSRCIKSDAEKRGVSLRQILGRKKTK